MSRISIYRDDTLVSESVLMRASVSLGRHPDNDIVLDDRTLSRFHARVERRGDRYFVVDLNAQNGVYLNGARITGATALSPGDRIVLGKYVAIFDPGAAAPGKRRGAGPGGSVKEEPALDVVAEPAPESTVTNADANDFSVEVTDDKLGLVPDDQPATALIKKRPSHEPTVVLLYNNLEVSKHPVGDIATIGRSKNCEIQISLLGLSRKHARLERRGDAVYVVDLESQNGTWVNNTRVDKERKLHHGDLINFYEYGVLFLEDPNVEIAFPGAGFEPPSDEHDDLLSMRETGRRAPPTLTPPPRGAGTERSPVPIVDSQASSELGGEGLELGDGAHFPDDDPFAPDDDEVGAGAGSGVPSGTQVQPRDDDSFRSSDLDEDVLAELDEFTDDPTTASKHGLDVDRTSHAKSALGKRPAWATEEELEVALLKREDRRTRRLEVFLDDQLYTQVPITQQVTRVGTNARCELALPKAAGLTGWQITLIAFPAATMLYRASVNARVIIDDTEVDQVVLKDGDVIQLGRVRIHYRVR